MAKQKMVVKVSMNWNKCRSKALKIAVGLRGVESAALKGDDKSQIEITGVDVDAVQLTTLLRKSVGHTELVSVSAEKKEEKKEDKKDEIKAMVWPSYMPPYHIYEVPVSDYREPSCSIM